MVGRVFYNPKLRQFVQVKAMYWSGAECGGYSNFYSDAQTVITRQMLSYDTLADCLLVGNIDKFKYAELVNISLDHRPYYAWKAK